MARGSSSRCRVLSLAKCSGFFSTSTRSCCISSVSYSFTVSPTWRSLGSTTRSTRPFSSGLEKGRVDLVVEPSERHVGLTVNEYETLLMQHDLVDVLKNPLHFARLKTRHLLDDP